MFYFGIPQYSGICCDKITTKIPMAFVEPLVKVQDEEVRSVGAKAAF
jgi:hypothetical protein